MPRCMTVMTAPVDFCTKVLDALMPHCMAMMKALVDLCWRQSMERVRRSEKTFCLELYNSDEFYADAGEGLGFF